MIKIKIDGYLIQNKLEAALKNIVGENSWIGREIHVPGSKKRWDMAFKRGNKIFIVEFDGDLHYRDSLVIKSDVEKDEIAKQNGYQVIRIPYWVQLTTQTLEYYFDLKADIQQNFPHGFIKTKIFPASYCEMGITRFQHELKSLPYNVRIDVIESIKKRVNEYGSKFVVPISLKHII